MVRKKPVKAPGVIEQSKDEALEFAESVINTVREPLISLDQDLRVVTVSRSFYEFFKVKPEDTVGQLIYDLGNKQWNIPKLRELLETILPQQTTFDNYEVEHNFATIGRRVMLLNARQIEQVLGKERIILLAIEDITERRQDEKVLEEKADALLGASEEKYRLLVENINDVFYILDKQGNITYVSPAIERLTKHKVGDLLGKPFIPIVYPDDLPGLLDNLKHLASGHLEPWEFRVQDKDGNILFVRSSSQPIYKDGQITGFTSLMVDITERKKAEEALQSEHTMLARTEGIAHIGSWEWDIATDTVTWSDELFRIFQRDPKEGAPSFAEHPAFYHPDDMARLQQAVEVCVADGTPYAFEMRAFRKDGETCVCMARGVAEMAPGGRAVRMFGSLQDITEHKRSEEARQVSDELLQAAINILPVGLWIIDAEGKIVTSSAAAQRIWAGVHYVGIDQLGEYKGWRTGNGKLIEAHEWAGARALEKGETTTEEEVEIECFDGTHKIILDSAVPLRKSDGSIVGAITINQDITELKQTEKELRRHREHLEAMVGERTAELKAVNQELESFSYSVSHDLRAPLHSIDGFSRALLQDYPDKLDEQGKHYLQRLGSNVQKMGELIDDLLKLSRITRSDMKLEIVNLSTLAQSIATELQKTRPERQVEFVITPGLSAKGDEHLLRLLLENLIDNAWKYTGKHQQARIEFGSSQADGKQVFLVRDDGAGFDMTYADKLFAPFQRLHSDSEFPGIGIGLATAQRIINRHGGRIWAEGEIEKGATFYFTLF